MLSNRAFLLTPGLKIIVSFTALFYSSVQSNTLGARDAGVLSPTAIAYYLAQVHHRAAAS